jgi:predicted phosphodiesterase
MTFKIGIISDTLGLLRPEAKRHWLTSITSSTAATSGVPKLWRIAPVSAIRGNVDTVDWAGAYPETEVVRLAGRSISVLHDLRTCRSIRLRGIDVVVSCHSHLPKIDTADGVLYLNPGSAGRRRGNLPVTLATIDVLPNGIRPLLHDLGDV